MERLIIIVTVAFLIPSTVPLPDHKTTADYMEGLFHLELKLQPETLERRGSQGASGVMQLEKAISDKSQNQTCAQDLKSEPQTSPCKGEATSQQKKTATVMDPVQKGNTSPQGQNRKVGFIHSSGGSGELYDKSSTATLRSPSPATGSKTHENIDSNEKPQKNSPPSSYRK